MKGVGGKRKEDNSFTFYPPTTWQVKKRWIEGKLRKGKFYRNNGFFALLHIFFFSIEIILFLKSFLHAGVYFFHLCFTCILPVFIQFKPTVSFRVDIIIIFLLFQLIYFISYFSYFHWFILYHISSISTDLFYIIFLLFQLIYFISYFSYFNCYILYHIFSI